MNRINGEFEGKFRRSCGLRTLLAATAIVALIVTIQPSRASPYGAEYDAAFKAMLENPTDLDITFKFAMLARRAGDLEGAVGALERMLIYNPDLPIIHYELGRLYARLGSIEAAKRYYRSALRYRPPPKIKAKIEAQIALLEQVSKPSSFSGGIFLGLQFQTNANLAPDDPAVRVGGFRARLADEFLEQADFGATVSGQLTHRYDLGRDPAVFLISEAQVYGSRQRKFDSNNIDLVSATVGPAFVLPNRLVVRPFVRGNWVLRDGSTFYRSYGGGVSIRKGLSGKPISGFFVDATLLHRDFKNSASSPALDRRDGLNVRFMAGANASMSATLEIVGFGSLEHQGTKAKYERNLGATVGVQVRQRVPSPLGRKAWDVSVTGQVGVRRYASPDPTIDPDEKRQDTNYAIGLGLGIPLSRDFSLAVQLRQQWRLSNLPNFEFDNTSVLTGIRFTF